MLEENALIKMMKKQDETNKLTIGENWRERDLSWKTAIVIEAVELIDSFGWKWWKHSLFDDLDNAKIEAIDLLHFTLSVAIKNKISKTDFLNFPSLVSKSKNIDKDTIIKETENLIGIALDDGSPKDLVFKTLKICGLLGMNHIDVAKLYFGKNVLNKFRQDNNYKSGGYQKTWNGEEDNVVMNRLSNDIRFDENFEKKLFSELKKIYMEL